MNANELADEVEMWGRDLLALNMKGGVPVIEGARLIRHQQAEIEELKAKLQLHEAMDNQCASLMQQFRKAKGDVHEFWSLYPRKNSVK